MPENDVVVEIRWRIEERNGRYWVVKSAPDHLGDETGPLTLEEAIDLVKHSHGATVRALRDLYFTCRDNFSDLRNSE
jgi:hypothetical protein